MLKIENTLSRRKEQFKPLGKEIGMYVCGPTSYGPGHAGHARTYIAFDVIRRYLEYKGYKVKFVMNITDVHDDIFKRVEKENTTLHALTNKYTNQFLSETNLLGIKKADCYPRVTRHVEEIIGFIKILINKGFAYSKDSSVYFDVSKFPDYGKLSGVEIGETLSGTRVETDKYKKKKAIDFALWKKSKPGEGLGWKSPWGHGRPGWHIECSVMSQKYLGEQFDIHGGAMDLIFPHHENEIAQSEAASGKSPFVKYWLHGGLLTINGEKMSRSLGNYITISELLMNYSPRLLRYFVIQSHYRSPVDFNKDAIEEAKQSLQRIDMFVHRIDKIALDDTAMRTEGGCEIVKVAVEEFENCMDDDFNTPATLASIFTLVKQANLLMDEKKLKGGDAENILSFLKRVDKVFNFIFFGREEREEIPETVLNLVRKREDLRKGKKWDEADRVRKEVGAMGYSIEDGVDGTEIRKAN